MDFFGGVGIPSTSIGNLRHAHNLGGMWNPHGELRGVATHNQFAIAICEQETIEEDLNDCTTNQPDVEGVVTIERCVSDEPFQCECDS